MADQFIIARGPGKLALQDATSGEDLTSEACVGPFVPSVDGSQLYVATADAVDVYNTQAPYTKVGRRLREKPVPHIRRAEPVSYPRCAGRQHP